MTNNKHQLVPLLDVKGAKAGASKQRTPSRTDDTIATIAKLSVAYGLTEGVIQGFGRNWTREDMLKRVYLEGTPIMAKDGTLMQDVEVDFRDGSIDQTAIEGMPSVTVETVVGVIIRADAPVVRTFTRAEVNSYDVRISIPRLVENTLEGDSNTRSVTFAIDVATDSGSFATYGEYTIDEKITNGFQRTYNVKMPRANNRTIRVRRVTADNTSDLIVDNITVEAITEIVEVQLRFPHTAVLWLKFDARQFSDVPKMEVLIDGKCDLRIPANYDPYTRQYATTGAGTTNGVWDGTWKLGYSDNPIWHWFDLATNERYGLGNRITIDIPDKFYLYAAAQYCDQLVDDGNGGQEPRFTCNNLYLQKATDAFTVFKDLSSIFRGKTIWDGSHLTPKIDAPRDGMLVFSRANCSSVKYASTSDNAQHNLFAVQYYDTENEYKSKYAYARDDANIQRRGRVSSSNVMAVGCTSLGQAQRTAEYLLKSELTETEIVTFVTGLDGLRPTIGDVFTFADDFIAGKINSGRIVSASGTTLVLDEPLDPQYDLDGTIIVNTTEQFASTRTIVTIAADLHTITIDEPILVVDPTGLVWAVKSASVGLREYVVDEIDYKPEENNFAISGVQYNRNKYPASDGAAHVPDAPISIIDPLIPLSPSLITASYHVAVDQGINIAIIDVAWAQSMRAAYYELQMRRDGSSWQNLGSTTSLTYTVDNAYNGQYEFRVRAVDVLKTASTWQTSQTLLVAGKVLPPPNLGFITVSSVLFGLDATWVFPERSTDTLSTRIQVMYSNPAHEMTQVYTYDVAYPTNKFELRNQQGGIDVWMRAALVDRYGIVGNYTPYATGRTGDDPEQILDLLAGHIALEQLDDALRAEIEAIKDIDIDLTEIRESAKNAEQIAANAQAAANDAKTVATNANTAINKEVQDRKADTLALQQSIAAEVSKLNDGISQEATYRKQGDDAQAAELKAYKVSNDAYVATVATKAESAVTQSEANAKNITTVTAAVNTKNRTYRQTAAPTAGLVVGDIWINTTAGANNAQKRWNGSAWDDITDPRVPATVDGLTALTGTVKDQGTKLDASIANVTQIQVDVGKMGDTITGNTNAIDSIRSDVTKQGKDITTVTARTTAIENKVTTVENNTNANTTAIQGVNATIKVLDGKVQTNTDATTALSGKVDTIEQNVSKKLDASVIVNYYTKTQTDSVVAGAVSEYNASLVIGTMNLLKLSKRPLSGTSYNIAFFEATRDFVAGETLTVTVKGTVSTARQFGIWLNAASFAIPPMTANGDGTFSTTFKVPAGVTNKTVGLYLVGNNSATDAWTFEWIKLEVGNKRSDWSPASADADATMASQANLIQATIAKVDVVDGRVTAVTNATTSLASRVTNVEQTVSQKLDASVINSYSTTTQMNSAIANGITQYDAKLVIGGNNILINSEGERTSTAASMREYLLYERSPEIKAFYDENLSKPVTVSFEIKVPVAGSVQVYSSNDSAHTASAATPQLEADVWTKVAVQLLPIKHAQNPNKTWSTLEFYGIYGTGRIPTVRKVKLEAGVKATAWNPSPRDYKAADEANAQAIQATEAKVSVQDGKITALTTQYTALNAKVDTNQSNLQVNYYTKAQADAATTAATTTLDAKFTGQINTVNNKVDNIKLDRTTIPDTRDINQPPSWYWTNYKRSVVTEFKSASVLGLSGYGNFVTLETTVPWDDSSGGQIQQIASNGDGLITATRYSISTTAWSAWKLVGKDNQDAIVTLTANVTNNYYTKAATDTAISSATTAVKAQLGTTVSYQAVTGRNGGGGLPNRAKGWYDAQGNVSNGISRGLNLVTFGADGKIDANTWFDTYADVNNQCELLNNALTALPAAKYFAIVGYDNLGAVGNSADPRAIALRNTLYACGATSEYLGSWVGTQIPFFVSRKGAALYNTISELFLSGTNNDGVAYDLVLLNGIPRGLGDSAYFGYIQGSNASALSTLTGTVNTLNGQVVAQGLALTQTKAELETTINDSVNGKKYIVDLSTLNANTWYPVTMAAAYQDQIARIIIRQSLGIYQAPWSTHSGGSFSMTLEWTDQASGWGGNPFERVISKSGYAWAALSPYGSVSQMTTSSTFLVYLRGGTKYNFFVTNAQEPIVRTTAYTAGAETVSPTTNYDQLVIPKSLNATAMNTASAQSELESKVSTVDGKVNALSTQTNTLQTTVNGQTTTIQQQAQSIDGIQGKYTIKINNNGYMTGYGLISTSNNGVTTSAFKVDADFFEIGKSGTGFKPVIITTTPQTINGQYYPVGAWFNHVGIVSASIKLAHIDTASITSLNALSANFGTWTTTAADGSKNVNTGATHKFYYASGQIAIFLGIE